MFVKYYIEHENCFSRNYECANTHIENESFLNFLQHLDFKSQIIPLVPCEMTPVLGFKCVT